MSLSLFGKTDSNYANCARHMLDVFAASATEREERIEVYRFKGAGGKAVRGSAVEAELARLCTASRASQSHINTNGPLLESKIRPPALS